MDIAKTSERTVSAPAPVHVDSVQTMNYDGIPIDILRFFNVEFGDIPQRDKDELGLISKWVFRDVETLGDGMKKLRDLEIRLGRPLGDRNDSRRMKIYNWVRMQQQIDDLRKRQEAISA